MPSNDSFRQMIHSRMKQVPVLMNETLNHWLKWLKIQKRESFSNETPLCAARDCSAVIFVWNYFYLPNGAKTVNVDNISFQ